VPAPSFKKYCEAIVVENELACIMDCCLFRGKGPTTVTFGVVIVVPLNEK
jgi:hypothetical protein